MENRSLAVYFIILFVLCTAVIVGARMWGQQGVYLAQVYMLTPAVAAIFTRLFFYGPRFKDANLRFGRVTDYLKFWLLALAITALSFGIYTLLGAISWDITGNAFLERLAEQFAATGQDLNDSLPPGFTPHMMLMLYFIGGLTIFNLIPGIITGFGEEFGHRGFMFPLLYRISPWVGFVIGGLIWYAWHLPLSLVIPQPLEYPLWQASLNLVVLAIGSICTFTYLAYVYVKSESIFVTAIAHITLNNAAISLSYFVIVQNQLLANLGTTLTMIIVIGILYYKKELDIFAQYFQVGPSGPLTQPTLRGAA
jgi:membrane protease YdiL (CAAX protease family)